jgi:Pretoxin HINT domain
MPLFIVTSKTDSLNNVVLFEHSQVFQDLFAICLNDLSFGYLPETTIGPSGTTVWRAMQARYFGVGPNASDLTKTKLYDLLENSNYPWPIAAIGVNSGYMLASGNSIAGSAVVYSSNHIDNPLLGYVTIIYDVSLCGGHGIWAVQDGTGAGTSVPEAYVQQTTKDILYRCLSYTEQILNGTPQDDVAAETDQNVLRTLTMLPLRNVNTTDGGCGAGRNNPGTTTTTTTNGNCFAASTRVLTPSGWTRISQLQAGDPIVSYDRVSGNARIRRVTKRLVHPPCGVWEVETLTGVIATTACHPFLTRHGWVAAHRLKKGDQFITLLGTEAVIASQGTTRFEPVYNLYTSGDHTFVVDGGIIVHNFAFFRSLRVVWHRVFFDWRTVTMPGKRRPCISVA